MQVRRQVPAAHPSWAVFIESFRFRLGESLTVTRQEISDDVWSEMEPLMPTVTGRSRPWTDHRLAVEGMAWKYCTGAPWRDVPERFGKWNSIYRRFNRWAENDFATVFLVLLERLGIIEPEAAAA